MGGRRSLRLAISPDTGDVIRHLPPEITRGVKAALRKLSDEPQMGEPRIGALDGLWNYRVRRYRIVYDVDRSARVLRVVAVGHRRQIYEEIAERVRTSGPETS